MVRLVNAPSTENFINFTNLFVCVGFILFIMLDSWHTVTKNLLSRKRRRYRTDKSIANCHM